MLMTDLNTTAASDDRLTMDEVLQLARSITNQFPEEYYRDLDRHDAFAEDFVNTALKAGLHTVMIPEEYGGMGLGVKEASVITEQVNYSGGAGANIHAAMFSMGILARHGSEEQKAKWLPQVASGDLRMISFALTTPNAGVETAKITTTARREGDEWVFNGQKVFISRAAHTDLMIMMARTSPSPDPAKPGLGISCFLVDLRDADPKQIQMNRIPVMFNHHTYEVFLDDFRVPADAIIGEEGQGFRYLLDGLNAERIVIAAECIGDGRWFVDKAVKYANERVIFDRPIGQNQGVQFPIARGYANLEAADLMRWKAAEVFDAGQNAGPQANMAKMLASEAAWELANVCMQTHGGYGLTEEYGVARKFCETRIFQIGPVPTNMILTYLSHKVLGLPKSY
jgi:acyl-CoA dehydrogenase